MSGGTPSELALPITCARRHPATAMALRVETIVRLASGKHTAVPARGGRDIPPGKDVEPLPGIPLERQHNRYEFKCPRCKNRYEVQVDRALLAVARAKELGAESIAIETLT